MKLKCLCSECHDKKIGVRQAKRARNGKHGSKALRRRPVAMIDRVMAAIGDRVQRRGALAICYEWHLTFPAKGENAVKATPWKVTLPGRLKFQTATP